MIYRAFFSNYDGHYEVQKWHRNSARVDHREYFPTYELAHQKVLEKFSDWLEHQKTRLKNLKTCSDEQKYDRAHLTPRITGFFLVTED